MKPQHDKKKNVLTLGLRKCENFKCKYNEKKRKQK